MKKLLSQIWTKFSSLFKRKPKKLPAKPVEEKKPREISLHKLLNTFYLHPEIIKQMPYEMLYNDIFDELGQMVSVLENQWMQNEIDYTLGYISLDAYCNNRLDIQDRFKETKKRYLHAMNLA